LANTHRTEGREGVLPLRGRGLLGKNQNVAEEKDAEKSDGSLIRGPRVLPAELGD